MLPTGETSIQKSLQSTTGESLAFAFASFAQAAGSLERSYGQLQQEVARLRSELNASNRELAKEREAVRQAKALAEVAAVLAHEIGNPLASLELFAGLLAGSNELGDDSRKIVDHLQAGLRALAATVNNVLSFHSAPCPQLVPTNLSSLVRMTLDFIEPLACLSAVELSYINEIGDFSIAADPHRLQQVLLNLAMNAIRFMPGGGIFEIFGSRVNDGVELRVRDSGPGIAPENRERIFEAGVTTRRGSPGLGLAVCRKIMQQHGGTIQAVHAPAGALFILHFKTL